MEPAGADSGISGDKVVDFAPGSGEELWAASATGEVAHWTGSEWRRAFEVDGLLYGLAYFDELLYLATEAGLFVYDPSTRTTVHNAEIGAAPALALAGSGTDLWVGTDANLWLLRNGTWRSLGLPPALAGSPVTALTVDEDDVVWLGTPLGVYWFDPAQSLWSAELIPILDDRNGPRPVFSLTAGNGAVWAASDGGGARRITAFGAQITDMARTVGGGVTTPLIRDITIGGDGTVWFATPLGVFRFREQMWRHEQHDAAAQEAGAGNVNDLLVDSRDTLWIATGGAGVRRQEPHAAGPRETIYSTATGDLPDDGVNTLAEDGNGHIWAGTFAGLAQYDGERWRTPVAVTELNSPVVTDLLAADDGLWIGTEGGLYRYDLATGRLAGIPQLGNAVIEALAHDGEGRTWVGTAGAGIYLYDDSRWRLLSGQTDAMEPTIDGVSYGGLAPDLSSPDGMWIHSRADQLIHHSNGRLTVIDIQSVLPSNIVYRLYADPVDGTLWIGGEGGVSHFDGLTWGNFTIEQGLQSTAIYAIARTAGDAYWFGGPEGLSRYVPDHSLPWVKITPPDDLRSADDSSWLVEAGEALNLTIAAGDLHTDAEYLHTYYRTGDDGPWQLTTGDQLSLSFPDVGNAIVEVMARDEAFNYSEIAEWPVTVLPPPDLVELPVLGTVQRTVFYALLLLGSTALFGFSYVSYEIIVGRIRTSEAVNRGYNPYVSGEPIRREDLFFGRRDLLQRIVDTLHNNSIMIHGERRIGKTTLLYQLANALREVDDPDYCFVPIYVDVEGTTETEFFHYLIEEIAMGVLLLDGLGHAVGDAVNQLRFHLVDGQDYTDRDFNFDLRRLTAALQEWIDAAMPGHRLRLILLLDEMDVMSGYNHLTQQQLRRIFMRDFASSLGAVVAGIQISKEWDRVESPWYNLFNEIEIQPFGRDSALELLVEPVRGIYRYDPAAAEFIIEHSNGRPFRLQQYALEAVNNMLQDGRRRITLADAETAYEHIVASYDDPALQEEEDVGHPEPQAPVPI